MSPAGATRDTQPIEEDLLTVFVRVLAWSLGLVLGAVVLWFASNVLAVVPAVAATRDVQLVARTTSVIAAGPPNPEPAALRADEPGGGDSGGGDSGGGDSGGSDSGDSDSGDSDSGDSDSGDSDSGDSDSGDSDSGDSDSGDSDGDSGGGESDDESTGDDAPDNSGTEDAGSDEAPDDSGTEDAGPDNSAPEDSGSEPAPDSSGSEPAPDDSGSEPAPDDSDGEDAPEDPTSDRTGDPAPALSDDGKDEDAADSSGDVGQPVTPPVTPEAPDDPATNGTTDEAPDPAAPDGAPDENPDVADPEDAPRDDAPVSARPTLVEELDGPFPPQYDFADRAPGEGAPEYVPIGEPDDGATERLPKREPMPGGVAPDDEPAGDELTEEDLARAEETSAPRVAPTLDEDPSAEPVRVAADGAGSPAEESTDGGGGEPVVFESEGRTYEIIGDDNDVEVNGEDTEVTAQPADDARSGTDLVGDEATSSPDRDAAAAGDAGTDAEPARNGGAGPTGPAPTAPLPAGPSPVPATPAPRPGGPSPGAEASGSSRNGAGRDDQRGAGAGPPGDTPAAGAGPDPDSASPDDGEVIAVRSDGRALVFEGDGNTVRVVGRGNDITENGVDLTETAPTTVPDPAGVDGAQPQGPTAPSRPATGNGPVEIAAADEDFQVIGDDNDAELDGNGLTVTSTEPTTPHDPGAVPPSQPAPALEPVQIRTDDTDLRFAGNANTVAFHGADNDIAVTGENNQIDASADGVDLSATGDDNTLTAIGDDNDITTVGDRTSATADGDDNTIDLHGAAATVVTIGDDNTQSITGDSTVAVGIGDDASITAAGADHDLSVYGDDPTNSENAAADQITVNGELRRGTVPPVSDDSASDAIAVGTGAVDESGQGTRALPNGALLVPTGDGGALTLTAEDLTRERDHAEVTPQPEHDRFLITAYDEQAPRSYDFTLGLTDDHSARPAADGGVDIIDADGVTVQRTPPGWAHDANGKNLPTALNVEGDKIIQPVALDEAEAWPVIADPAFAGAGEPPGDLGATVPAVSPGPAGPNAGSSAAADRQVAQPAPSALPGPGERPGETRTLPPPAGPDAGSSAAADRQVAAPQAPAIPAPVDRAAAERAERADRQERADRAAATAPVAPAAPVAAVVPEPPVQVVADPPDPAPDPAVIERLDPAPDPRDPATQFTEEIAETPGQPVPSQADPADPVVPAVPAVPAVPDPAASGPAVPPTAADPDVGTGDDASIPASTATEPTDAAPAPNGQPIAPEYLPVPGQTDWAPLPDSNGTVIGVNGNGDRIVEYPHGGRTTVDDSGASNDVAGAPAGDAEAVTPDGEASAAPTLPAGGQSGPGEGNGVPHAPPADDAVDADPNASDPDPAVTELLGLAPDPRDPNTLFTEEIARTPGQPVDPVDDPTLTPFTGPIAAGPDGNVERPVVDAGGNVVPGLITGPDGDPVEAAPVAPAQPAGGLVPGGQSGPGEGNGVPYVPPADDGSELPLSGKGVPCITACPPDPATAGPDTPALPFIPTTDTGSDVADPFGPPGPPEPANGTSWTGDDGNSYRRLPDGVVEQQSPDGSFSAIEGLGPPPALWTAPDGTSVWTGQDGEVYHEIPDGGGVERRNPDGSFTPTDLGSPVRVWTGGDGRTYRSTEPDPSGLRDTEVRTAPGQYGDAQFPTTHQVEPGETLADLAEQYGTDVPQLVRDNPGIITDPNAVAEGADLAIRPRDYGTAVIAPGSTFGDVAASAGLTPDQLAELNPEITDPGRLVAGDALRVTPPSPTGTDPGPLPRAPDAPIVEIQPPQEAQQEATAVRGEALATGVGLGVAKAYEKAVASDPVAAQPTPAQETAARTAKVISASARTLSVAGAGIGQVVNDSANPDLNNEQRAGRAVAQAATVGGASILGGIAAGAAIGSVVPGPGTLFGAIAGGLAVAASGFVAGTIVDGVNDRFVDWAGDTVDQAIPPRRREDGG